MTDRFDPHEIQADYLKEMDFRTTLVDLVYRASGTARDSYTFSNENETDRLDAIRILQPLLEEFRGMMPLRELNDRTYWVAANHFILKYSLGPLITKFDVGLPRNR